MFPTRILFGLAAALGVAQAARTVTLTYKGGAANLVTFDGNPDTNAIKIDIEPNGDLEYHESFKFKVKPDGKRGWANCQVDGTWQAGVNDDLVEFRISDDPNYWVGPCAQYKGFTITCTEKAGGMCAPPGDSHLPDQ